MKAIETARASLIDFTTFTFPNYRVAPHHRKIAEVMERVERGELKRVMFFMPPRHGKSELVSKRFPAWYIGSNPTKQLITASYGQDLASDFGRDVRNIVASPEYKVLFPGVSIASDSAAKNRWHTSKGGSYVAAGVGSAITGRGADCLLGETVIFTNNGETAIKTIVDSAVPCMVLSYDERTERMVYRSVKAVARREASCFYRVRTAAGRVVEATGDHRFYTSRGYIEARLLAKGDVLLCCVPNAGDENSGGSVKEPTPGAVQSVLLERMLGQGGEQAKRQGNGFMQGVRQVDAAPEREGSTGALLLSGVQKSTFHGFEAGTKSGASGHDTGADLRVLQSGVQAEDEADDRSVLLPCMQGPWPRGRHDGERESGLEEWGESASAATSFRQGVQEDEAADNRSGQQKVRGVRISESSGGSPHRHECGQQQMVESGDPLCDLPHGVAWGGKVEAKEDIVALVERVCEPTTVYDIQVEGTECFFANGVLVHNCLLIDDPLKDREEADSETIRNKVWDWYTSTAYTRLMPGGAVVLTMTRWHEDDLAGRLLAEMANGGEQWHVLKLPAIDKNGSALWPGAYDDEALNRIRVAIGERDWSALYQQEPRPLEGALFKTALIQAIDAAPAGGKLVRAWDLAATKQVGTRDPDWTVGVLLQRTDVGAFVIHDVVRFRGGPDEVEATIVATASRDGRDVAISLPQDPGQAGKSQALYFTRKLAGYTVKSTPETGDKATRAMPFAAQVNIGNVAMVKAPWNRSFIDELAGFPSATHDDQVDAGSRAFSELIAPRRSFFG